MDTPKPGVWPQINSFIRHQVGRIVMGANFIGACTCVVYFLAFESDLTFNQMHQPIIIAALFFAITLAIGIIVTLRWQKAIITFLDCKLREAPVPAESVALVQCKMLNLPLFMARVSLMNWIIASFFFVVIQEPFAPSGLETAGLNFLPELRIFFGVFISGMVTVSIIYFAIEARAREYLPHFFPDGGLVQTKGAFKLRLRRRTLVTFGLISLLPMIIMALLSYNKAKSMLVLPPADVIQSLFYLTAFLLLIAISLAILLSHQFAASIIRPVLEMEKAMGKVSNGDLSISVPVTTNDELGALSDHFNQMVLGLRERYHLRRSLALAGEIQQKLLPQTVPDLKGFDIFGAITYCDETGGDYFDFITLGDDAKNLLAIVVGDVTGHGIPSALLMATARASLRQRAAMIDDPAKIVADVNRQLVLDIEDDGHFITLFMAIIDPSDGVMRWVNAGHDPALLYDTRTDSFEELGGRHLPVGVSSEAEFSSSAKNLAPGQTIIIGTDGIWESHNGSGEMFGKDRLKKVIRQSVHLSAQKTVAAVVDTVKEFCDKEPISDDITIVVIKKSG